MENYKDHVLRKLQKFKSSTDIIISDHARIRLVQRQIDEKVIIENILNPKRLVYALQEEARGIGEEKFDCYFAYSKRLCHRYVLVIKKNVIVITVVKINCRWQEIVEKKLLSNPVRRRKK